MTRGERIAWTWTLCAVALVLVAGTYAARRYGDPAFSFCKDVDLRAIKRGGAPGRLATNVLAAEDAPAALRASALALWQSD